MTQYGHHGVYGSNVWQWDTDDYFKVDAGGFKWAVVRLDTHSQVAQWLHERGIRVILQAVDRFNHYEGDPAGWAKECWNKALEFKEYADLICLDNEPNLTLGRCSQWWAEQYTRWFRVVMAEFRYLDSYTGHWKLLHPAFVSHREYNFETWLKTCRENILESEGFCAHSYFQTFDTMNNPEFGGSYMVYREHYPDKALYLTEYCPDIAGISETERATTIKRYLDIIEGEVKCACYFILGGTHHWEKYHLPKETAIKLGEII